jgi:hypothetical protein
MGFLSDSKSVVTNTTQNTADSYNRAMTSNKVLSESGNTTVNLAGNSGGAGDNLTKYMPLLAILCFGLAVVLFLTQKAAPPWKT